MAVPAGQHFHACSEPFLSSCMLPLESQSVFSVGPNAQPRTCRCALKLCVSGIYIEQRPAYRCVLRMQDSSKGSLRNCLLGIAAAASVILPSALMPSPVTIYTLNATHPT